MSVIAKAFHGLKDIDDTVPLNSMDSACLDEIRTVLIRHGMLDRFGVTLLHTHFPVYEGETLLETCDIEARSLTMRVAQEGTQTEAGTVGTAWRLREHGDVITSAICSQRCVARNGSHDIKHVKMAG